MIDRKLLRELIMIQLEKIEIIKKMEYHKASILRDTEIRLLKLLDLEKLDTFELYQLYSPGITFEEYNNIRSEADFIKYDRNYKLKKLGI